jgi:hypothetical protein
MAIHYPIIPISPPTRKELERFWKCVNKSEDCWNWSGFILSGGYGQFKRSPAVRGSSDKPRVQAHRMMWTIINGEIPSGMLICHTCDNRRCVNPNHLFLGTGADNTADMVRKGRGATGDRNAARLYPEKWHRGEDHHKAKLTEPDVLAIRSCFVPGSGMAPILAQRYGVNKSAIWKIIRHENWRHLPPI